MFGVNYLNPIPPPSAWLHHAHALTQIRKYIQTICELILSTFKAPYDETIRVLHLLHPLVKIDVTLFVDDFHPRTKVILNWEPFIFVLACSPHLFSNGPLGMVYELSQNYFVPDEWFWPLFQSMWAHCLRSCSTFSIAFSFCILTFNIGKVVWRHTSHHNQWSDLLPSCPCICYLV
jgi:hypothetical protein